MLGSLILTAFLLGHPAQGFYENFSLEKEQGAYELISSESNFYCAKAQRFDLAVSGADVEITLSNAEEIVGRENIQGVNTGQHTKSENLTSIVYTRHVYIGGQLKRQSSTWAFGVVPAPFVDNRIVVSFLGAGRISYNYASFGTAVCHYQKVH